MTGAEGVERRIDLQPRRALELRQQQRVRDGLGVGVGELLIIGLREEETTPLFSETVERGTLSCGRLRDLIAQDPRERGKELGEVLRGLRYNRFPVQEVAQEHPEPVHRIVLEGACPGCRQVLGNANTRHQLPAAVE